MGEKKPNISGRGDQQENRSQSKFSTQKRGSQQGQKTVKCYFHSSGCLTEHENFFGGKLVRVFVLPPFGCWVVFCLLSILFLNNPLFAGKERKESVDKLTFFCNTREGMDRGRLDWMEERRETSKGRWTPSRTLTKHSTHTGHNSRILVVGM